MEDSLIVLFDGVCKLCNRSVQFIIERDSQAVFMFSPLQSAFSRKCLQSHGLSPDDFDGLVLIKNGKLLVKSDAAVEIAKEFNGLWKLLIWAKLIPRPIRETVYTVIARHRYRWFGKRDSCMVPTDEFKARFIE